MAGTPLSMGENPWKLALERASKSTAAVISSLQYHYDTEKPVSLEGSSFVVGDGLILTNGHVAGSGPSYIICKFTTRDEVEARVVYADPVHDYAYLKFDPKADTIKDMDIYKLEMRPDLARVGDKIQIIGNDQRKRFSSSEGTIDRVDGNIGDSWGETDDPVFTDFNSHCIQTASINSKGSSGSPVINMAGFVVAMVASKSKDGATNYCLPLEHACYALEFVQKGLPVPRGDIQCQWSFEPFSECEKLGLSRNWRSMLKGTEAIGMLVAKTIIPGGPSDDIVQVGDILLKVEGETVTRFTLLEKFLDRNVGRKIRLGLHRGDTEVEVNVSVGDLHKTTPDSFLSIGGARGPSFHALSYQFARRYQIPCGGVFMPAGIGAFRSVKSNSIIQSFDGRKTPDLPTFIEIIKTLPARERVIVEYVVVFDLPTTHSQYVIISRLWAEMTLVSRNANGSWTTTTIAPILRAVDEPKIQIARYPNMKQFGSQALACTSYSWVGIDFNTLIPLDGATDTCQEGWGIIIDSINGLVVTSTAVAPSKLGNVNIYFARSAILEGKVISIHPNHGWAVIAYDASLVDGPMKPAKLSTEPMTVGAMTCFIGINAWQLQLQETKTKISNRLIENFPTDKTGPQYRVTNVDRYSVETRNSRDCGYGAFVKEDGTLEAFWMSMPDTDQNGKSGAWAFGLETSIVSPVIAKIQKDSDAPPLRFVNVEYEVITIAKAIITGVPDTWINKIVQASDCVKGYEIFRVAKVAIEDKSGFREGDVILALNSKVPVRFSDFDAVYKDESFNATLIRDRREETLKIYTTLASCNGTTRFVDFYGAVVQEPHLEVRRYVMKLYSKVYVSGVTSGSPAKHFNLKKATFITKVNELDTLDIDDFLRIVKRIPVDKYFKIETVNMEGRPVIVSMKKITAHFSLDEWTYKNGWHKAIHEP